MLNNIVELKHISKVYGDESILHHLDLSIPNGTFTTILGASGCGKTTLLRLISGLEMPNHGQIIINGKDVTDLPPQQRQVNTVFQSYALFPHMTVAQNIAFGLQCEHLPKDEISKRVEEALKVVHLEKFRDRLPKQLSGGQQQRVAIARALAKKPLVLLLDEPLSALDYRLRKTMQMQLKSMQRELGITFILVTHDQEEALAMSDNIVVLDHGEVQQMGPPREIYEEPANMHVAKFIGETNVLKTRITDANLETVTVEIEGLSFELKNKKGFTKADSINTVVRPEDLRVWDRSEIESTEGMMTGKVTEVIYKGTTVDLQVELDTGTTLFATEFFDEDDADLDYHLNERVWVQWHPGWEVLLHNEEL
tara:strand:+ start:12554 stop:13651 length:1098 start_codon:yes stop_codon:yes gene_type:complete